jgi:hypothetical protein
MYICDVYKDEVNLSFFKKLQNSLPPVLDAYPDTKTWSTMKLGKITNAELIK